MWLVGEPEFKWGISQETVVVDQEKDDDGSDEGMAVEIERGGWIQDTWHLHQKNIKQEGIEGRTMSFEKDVLWALSSDKI